MLLGLPVRRRSIIILQRFTVILSVLLIVTSLVLVALAVVRYPAYWSQPSAGRFLLDPVSFLVGYAICLMILTGRQPPLAVSRIATFFGLLTGGLEVLNVALENLLPAVWHGSAISIPLMLLPFLLWATAAALATRRTGTFRSGLLAGVLSGAFCMLAAVTAGFLVELDLRPPSTASVATWAEYLRSHWTDPRAFAIANTFDSGFTHLFFAPIVAAILGSLGSGLTLLAMRRSNPMVQSH